MTNRWVLVLACSHNLLADEPALVGDHDYCPGCGMTFPIVDVYTHKDADL